MHKRSNDTRRRILDSAIKIFSRKGYGAASIEGIAKHADITSKDIRKYYDNKQSLFTSCIKSIAKEPWEFRTPVELISTPEDFYKALYIIAKGLNEVFTQPDYIQLIKVVISEVDSQPDLEGLLEDGITRQAIEELVKLFESATENNVISTHDPVVSAHRFVGGFLTNVYLDGLILSTPGKMRKYTPKELFGVVLHHMLLILIGEVATEH